MSERDEITRLIKACDEQLRSAPSGSASALPAPISYDEWRALGPDKAAEYMAARLGCNDDRKRKLVMVLNAFWNETPTNADLSGASDASAPRKS